MPESILTNTKKLLGIAEEYTAFDVDIKIFINSALSTLREVGIGPSQGFAIQDANATWEDFLQDETDPLRFEAVQTYVYLRVRLIFDPPPTAFAVQAMKEQIQEHLWRLSTVREETEWTSPS